MVEKQSEIFQIWAGLQLKIFLIFDFGVYAEKFYKKRSRMLVFFSIGWADPKFRAFLDFLRLGHLIGLLFHWIGKDGLRNSVLPSSRTTSDPVITSLSR